MRLRTTLALIACSLSAVPTLAQHSAPSEFDSAVYEQLLIKSRARHLNGKPSPRGFLYHYIGDDALRAAQESGDLSPLNPTLSPGSGTRAFALALVGHVPRVLRPAAAGTKPLEVGVAKLHLTEPRRRPLKLESFILLPSLEIRPLPPGSTNSNRVAGDLTEIFNERTEGNP